MKNAFSLIDTTNNAIVLAIRNDFLNLFCYGEDKLTIWLLDEAVTPYWGVNFRAIQTLIAENQCEDLYNALAMKIEYHPEFETEYSYRYVECSYRELKAYIKDVTLLVKLIDGYTIPSDKNVLKNPILVVE